MDLLFSECVLLCFCGWVCWRLDSFSIIWRGGGGVWQTPKKKKKTDSKSNPVNIKHMPQLKDYTCTYAKFIVCFMGNNSLYPVHYLNFLMLVCDACTKSKLLCFQMYLLQWLKSKKLAEFIKNNSFYDALIEFYWCLHSVTFSVKFASFWIKKTHDLF